MFVPNIWEMPSGREAERVRLGPCETDMDAEVSASM